MRTLPAGIMVLGLLSVTPAQAKKNSAPRIPPLHLAQPLSVVACDGPAQASVEVPAFRAEVPCLEARAELEHLSGPHTFRFLWYDPQRSEYAATEGQWTFQPEAGKTGYHRRATIRQRIAVAGQRASLLLGEWKLVAELDDTHIGQTRFRLDPEPLPKSPLLDESKALFQSGRFSEALDKLAELQRGPIQVGVQAEALWWTALSCEATNESERAQEALVKLVEVQPAYAVDAGEAKRLGGERLLGVLDELRRSRDPALLMSTAYPTQVELSKAEEAPVLAKRWPTWKKILIYGGIPVAVGAGVFLVAGGSGESGPDPLELEVRIVESTRDQQFECVPLNGPGTVSRTFEATVRGGSGRYGINWNFNRTGEPGQVSPATATDVTRQQVTYWIQSLQGLGTYVVAVEVTDKDATELPAVRGTVVLVISFSAVCAGP